MRATATLVGLLLMGATASAREIGTAGAVNPASTGTPPSAATRTLQIGSKVVFKERIVTTGSGSVQLIFLDKTTLSVGPSTSLVIDEFVYDSNSGRGSMTATLVKGVARLVGGNASHTGGAQVKTPFATIGIRGGVATVEVTPCSGGNASTCGAKVTNHFGSVSVTTGSSTEIIRKPGWSVSVSGVGGAPSAPQRVTQAEVAASNASLTSKPGQTGGAGAKASPAAVAQANVAGPVIAQIGSGVAAVQPQNQARRTTLATSLALSLSPTDATTPTSIQSQVGSIQQQALGRVTPTSISTPTVTQVGADPTLPTTAPMPSPSVPLPAPLVIPARAFALRMSIDPNLGSGMPYLPAAFVAAGGTPFNSEVLGYGVGGTNPDSTPNKTSRVIQAGLNIVGSGSSQASTISVFAGTAFVSNLTGENTFGGGFTASTRLASTDFGGRASGGFVADSSAGISFDSTFTPTRIAGVNGSLSGDRIVPETAFFNPGNGQPGVNYGFTQVASQIATPAGLGVDRPTTALTGYAAGLGRSFNLTSQTFAAPSFAFEGFLNVNLDASSSRFGVAINGGRATGGAGNTFNSANLTYGFAGAGTETDRGAYVDSKTFAARESRNLDANRTFPATVNGTGVTSHRGVFVASEMVNAKAAFPTTTFCNCEYTKWGFWSSETARTTGGQDFRDVIHLGQWVAGSPTPLGQLPTAGSATYDGHVIASIKSGTSEYVSAANLRNVVNFNSNSGTSAVTNLDGRTYAGTLSVTRSGVAGVNASLASTAGPTTSMNLIGQFFKGASGPAGEMGGGVQISGTNYLGRGIFAASAPAPQ